MEGESERERGEGMHTHTNAHTTAYAHAYTERTHTHTHTHTLQRKSAPPQVDSKKGGKGGASKKGVVAGFVDQFTFQPKLNPKSLEVCARARARARGRPHTYAQCGANFAL